MSPDRQQHRQKNHEHTQAGAQMKYKQEINKSNPPSQAYIAYLLKFW